MIYTKDGMSYLLFAEKERLFTYKDDKYEIREWKEGIELRDTRSEKESRYVYGVDLLLWMELLNSYKTTSLLQNITNGEL